MRPIVMMSSRIARTASKASLGFALLSSFSTVRRSSETLSNVGAPRTHKSGRGRGGARRSRRGGACYQEAGVGAGWERGGSGGRAGRRAIHQAGAHLLEEILKEKGEELTRELETLVAAVVHVIEVAVVPLSLDHPPEHLRSPAGGGGGGGGSPHATSPREPTAGGRGRAAGGPPPHLCSGGGRRACSAPVSAAGQA